MDVGRENGKDERGEAARGALMRRARDDGGRPRRRMARPRVRGKLLSLRIHETARLGAGPIDVTHAVASMPCVGAM